MNKIFEELMNAEFGYMISNSFNANRFEYHAGKYMAYYDLMNGSCFYPDISENTNYIRGYNDGVRLINGFNLRGGDNK